MPWGKDGIIFLHARAGAPKANARLACIRALVGVAKVRFLGGRPP